VLDNWERTCRDVRLDVALQVDRERRVLLTWLRQVRQGTRRAKSNLVAAGFRPPVPATGEPVG